MKSISKLRNSIVQGTPSSSQVRVEKGIRILKDNREPMEKGVQIKRHESKARLTN